MKSEDKSLSFNAVKPDVLIVNNDVEEGITKGFIQYIKENSNNPKISNNEATKGNTKINNEIVLCGVSSFDNSSIFFANKTTTNNKKVSPNGNTF